ARARRVLEPWIDAVTLALDVDGSPEPRLGLEGYTSDWPGILESVRQAGLCSAKEAAELLTWPGLRSDSDHLPEPLGRMSRFLGGRRRCVLHRGLSHLKLVIDPDRSLEAKI